MPYLYGNDFSAVQQAAQADEARRQQALQFAFGHLQQANQHAAQRTQFNREMAMRQAMQDWNQQEAEKRFGENVRQFDIGTGLTKDYYAMLRDKATAPKPITTADLARIPGEVWNNPDDVRANIYGGLRMTPEQVAIVESQVQPYRKAVLGQHSEEAQAARELNIEPRKKAIMQQQLEAAKGYEGPRSQWWNPWTWGDDVGNVRADIAPGVAAQQAALATRMARSRSLQNALTQNPQTGQFTFTTPPPAGMPAWNPTNRFAMSPRMMSPPINYGTNAPVIDLPPSAALVTNRMPAIDYSPQMPPTMPVTNAVVRVLMPNGKILRGPASNAPALLKMGGRIIQ